MTSIAPPSNTRNNKTTDDWITPLWLREAIGPFDLDPCASVTQPWPMAARQYTINDNGLALPWGGFVWMNPPYGKAIDIWLGRLANHGNGIALVFARTRPKRFSAEFGQKPALFCF